MNKTILDVLERSENLEASLKTLAYSMEAMNGIDNSEKELREIGWNIASQIECLQEYHAKTLQLVEQLKNDLSESVELPEIKEKILTREEATILFKKNAILLNQKMDVVPFYRVIDIFGKEAALFLAETMLCSSGGMEYGSDIGGCGENIDYLYETGFMQVVMNHNIMILEKINAKSESGQFWNQLWEEECKRRNEKDKEEERRRRERKKRELKKEGEKK